MDRKRSFADLPPDVLREIFISCLPTLPSFRTEDAPMLLTHVCSSWRDVALSSNVLWSHIIVPKWRQAPEGLDKLAALWLGRAGRCPLDVEIRLLQKHDYDECHGFRPESDDESDEYSSASTDEIDGYSSAPTDSSDGRKKAQFEAILDLLAPHRAQFRSFKGYFPDGYMTRLGVSTMQNAEEISYLVAHARFACAYAADSNPSAKVLDIGSARDKLERLTIVGCDVDIKSVMAQERLTHLQLKGRRLPAEVAVLLLQSLPNLKTVELGLGRSYPELQDEMKELLTDFKNLNERVQMSDLQSIVVSTPFEDALLGTLLDRICAPNLQEFALQDTGHHHSTFCWDALQEFLKASGLPLRYLKLKRCKCAPVHLLDTLALCPKLEHLSIENASLSDDLFRGLTRTGPAWQGHLLPEMQSFRLYRCDGFSGITLQQLLMSRAADAPAGLSKLEDVYISNCSDMFEDDKQRLMSCGIEKINVILQREYRITSEMEADLDISFYLNSDDDLW